MVEKRGWVAVVDDEASVRKALSRLLRSKEYAVDTFATAEEFFAANPKDGPKCAILDLAMPGVGGLEILARIVEEELEYGIVFLTGHGDIRSSVDAMKLGAIDFLTKPVDEALLFAAIDEALAQQNSRLAQRNRVAESRARFSKLTNREREVLELIVTGKLNKQIAAELGISEKTVKAHRAQVMRKTQSGSLAVLVQLHMAMRAELP